ncbi:C6 transcription factor [Histoplasma ohiense]|nr:C6 transcription factor [Histoplasma ohiense (nom. inval.)]
MDADPRVPLRQSAPSQSSSTPTSDLSAQQTHNSYYYDSPNQQSPHSATLGSGPLDDDDSRDHERDHGIALGLGLGPGPRTGTYTESIAVTDINNPNNPNDPLADLKRPRACEACRQLKVRCDPHPESPDGPCKRCAKANRRCVVTVPTRKRQKKADSRVAELERKIDALTASLQATRARNGSNVGGGAPESSALRSGSAAEDLPAAHWMGAQRQGSENRRSTTGGFTAGLAGNKRFASGEFKPRLGAGVLVPLAARPHSPTTESSSTFYNGSNHGGDGNDPDSWAPLLPSIDRAPKARYDYEYTDVIDRGVVDTEMALKCFNRYVNEMSPLLPFIVFPPETTMAQVRRTKPILLLAILAVSVGIFNPELQVTLLNEVFRLFADHVIVRGSKSLELVQAIVVSIIWYRPPEHYEEMKFYQLIHIATTMAMDLGMNRRTKSTAKSKSMGMWRELMGKKTVMVEPDAPETRRAWLGCYFMCVNVAMSLRRSLLTRWHPYMDESLEILETSPDALPSDKTLVQWVKLAHLGEEVLFQFSMDDPVTNVDITDPKSQYALKGFERRLAEWRKEVPPECYSPIMHHYELILNVYMHEIGMHADHNIDDFKPPFLNSLSTENPIDLGTPAHVDALTVCLTSIHDAFETFISLDYLTIQSIPTIHFVRTAYASVALIKLHTAASYPATRLGQVFNPTDFKIEYFLTKVIAQLKDSGDRISGRVTSRFALMLGMLKTWFIKRKEGKPITGNGPPYSFFQPKDIRAYLAPEPRESESQSAKQNQDTSNSEPTPLHLQTHTTVGGPEIQHSHHSPSNLSPQNIRTDAHPTSLPNHPPSTATSDAASNTVSQSDHWTPFPPSAGMGIFPTAPNLPLSSQGLSHNQNPQNPTQGYVPAVPGGIGNPQHAEMDPQQAFMSNQNMQFMFQPDELAVLGNIWDDIFFTFPLDETGQPW